MTAHWDVVQVKRKLAEMHDRGTVSEEVINTVVKSGLCAPVESEIFDYKETQDNTPSAISKLIRHIVSFYNTYGGYLLFGVQEIESETKFRVHGVSENFIDIESIKAKIRDSVGERIQICGNYFESSNENENPTNLYLLFIPKRPENGRPPIHFIKDSPGQVFKKDDIYCRVGDECIEAKGPRLFSLSQERPNPYLSNAATWGFEQAITKRIENNLPDRNFVCPRFVGRGTYLNKLWRWLGDDLSYVKMLAGEGGLGKSSIAYEFADRLSQTKNVPFEQVIWLTAKKRQFVGKDDEYMSVPETHYTTYAGLISSILKRLPISLNNEEILEMSTDEIKRQVRDGLSEYPSFVIIDDIDSLDAEQQRQVVELGFVLGSVKSKLLLTTRHNVAYSHDLAIQIEGFGEEEFSDYLTSLRERKVLQRDLTSSEKNKIHKLTLGSPLYTESICRLLRFQSFNEAVKDWGQDAGARVRAAALDREVSMLSPEAKRVLLSAALLSEASVPELAEVTEYPQESVLQYIQELSSLFLLAGETLADQPRFNVPSNTVRLVTERAATLVTDVKKLETRSKQIRNGGLKGKSSDNRVAYAISQAQSLIRSSDVEGALKTVDEARRRIKGNPDLLGFRAEVLMKFTPPKFEEARRNARDAYQSGCRRTSTYFAWFEAEWAAGHFIGATECAEAAIKNSVPGNGEWLVKLAAAHASAADSQKAGIAAEVRIEKYLAASAALRQAINSTRGQDTNLWEGLQYDVHDRIWSLCSGELIDLDSIEVAVKSLEKLWEFGDYRFTNANHAMAVSNAICRFIEASTIRKTSAGIIAAEIRFNRSIKLLRNRIGKYPNDSRHPAVRDFISVAIERFSKSTGSLS